MLPLIGWTGKRADSDWLDSKMSPATHLGHLPLCQGKTVQKETCLSVNGHLVPFRPDGLGTTAGLRLSN